MMRTEADRQEQHDRMTSCLEIMARAMLRARGESDWTVRNITHTVEQCAEAIGVNYWENVMRKDDSIDDAILGIIDFQGKASHE